MILVIMTRHDVADLRFDTLLHGQEVVVKRRLRVKIWVQGLGGSDILHKDANVWCRTVGMGWL